MALTASASGAKRLPFVLFKGKGKTAEDRELKARPDIVVAFSDNGWFNKELTIDWRQRVMGSMTFGKRLLVWDSYLCHLTDSVTAERCQKRILSAVIPGGCNELVQAPDVSWNKPFKSSIRELYDEWLATGDKTYTAACNIRATTMSKLCDIIVKSWRSLSPDLIKNSFTCCGQVPGATVAQLQPANVVEEFEDELDQEANVLGEVAADDGAAGGTSSEDDDDDDDDVDSAATAVSAAPADSLLTEESAATAHLEVAHVTMETADSDDDFVAVL